MIQAYQKRCFYVVDYIIDLAKRSQKRLMIRLVKGAYWDSEIKKAQLKVCLIIRCLPVKCILTYLILPVHVSCWQNRTISIRNSRHIMRRPLPIYQLANPERYYAGQYEFQCLHGMGEPLYENVVGDKAAGKLVFLAGSMPVGNHETLLAYLVRRLLKMAPILHSSIELPIRA